MYKNTLEKQSEVFSSLVDGACSILKSLAHSHDVCSKNISDCLVDAMNFLSKIPVPAAPSLAAPAPSARIESDDESANDGPSLPLVTKQPERPQITEPVDQLSRNQMRMRMYELAQKCTFDVQNVLLTKLMDSHKGFIKMMAQSSGHNSDNLKANLKCAIDSIAD